MDLSNDILDPNIKQTNVTLKPIIGSFSEISHDIKSIITSNISNPSSTLDHVKNSISIEDVKHANLHVSDEEREDIKAFREDALKHAGHEKQHMAMVMILLVAMVSSQVLLVWWKSKYQKSYIQASMIAMYLIPFGISAYRHWWRFVAIWVFMTLITLVLVWRPLFMPNFSKGSSIPRLLYKWFFAVYSVASLVAVTGYTIILLTFFGINILLNISPQTALDIGFVLLFYGIYYGVLCRDFTDFLVDKLAAQIGYYNPLSALPTKSLLSNICAICGADNGDNENIDIDGVANSDPLLMGDTNDSNENEFHHDYENLIDYSDNPNPKERVFILTCGHKFHEYCIYGWCLVGKRQVCPFCREKVDLGRLFSALPFQKPHYLYGNLLDFIRYLFAWQPLIFLVVHFLDYELGLE